MSRAVRLRSDIEYKVMLLEGKPQFENFYKEELIEFCKVAQKIILEIQQEKKQLKEQLHQRDEAIEESINHLDCFISDINLSKYDTLKILMHTKKILNKYKKEEGE